MDIRLEERAGQPTLSIRRVVPYDRLGEFMGEVFPRVFRYLQDQGLQPASHPFSLYRKVSGQSVDVESGFAVAQEAVGEGDITPNQLPGGKVVVTMHVGHYDTLTQNPSNHRAVVQGPRIDRRQNGLGNLHHRSSRRTRYFQVAARCAGW